MPAPPTGDSCVAVAVVCSRDGVPALTGMCRAFNHERPAIKLPPAGLKVECCFVDGRDHPGILAVRESELPERGADVPAVKRRAHNGHPFGLPP